MSKETKETKCDEMKCHTMKCDSCRAQASKNLEEKDRYGINDTIALVVSVMGIMIVFVTIILLLKYFT